MKETNSLLAYAPKKSEIEQPVVSTPEAHGKDVKVSSGLRPLLSEENLEDMHP